jgi:hypothetical protein
MGAMKIGLDENFSQVKILKFPCENPSFFHNEMCSSAAVCALAFEGTHRWHQSRNWYTQ